MIGKLSKGRSFRGVLNYAMAKPSARRLGGTLAASSPRGMAREFGMYRGGENPNKARKAVLHGALSLAPGETLDGDDWEEAARIWLRHQGYDPNSDQWVAIQHDDTDHQHVHIIASRIDPATGKLRSDAKDYQAQERAMRDIERRMGLQRVRSSSEMDPSERRGQLSQGEIGYWERTGRAGWKAQIREAVDQALAETSDINQFQSALKDKGVTLHTRKTKAGEVRGLSFEPDWEPGKRVSSSKLGHAYKLNQLRERFRQETEHGESPGSPDRSRTPSQQQDPTSDPRSSPERGPAPGERPGPDAPAPDDRRGDRDSRGDSDERESSDTASNALTGFEIDEDWLQRWRAQDLDPEDADDPGPGPRP